ncbi:MAG: HAD family acid phosphatase, partial [Pseudomonadota bacterium]
LLEAGFTTDADHVMLAREQPGWGKEKLTRRLQIAETHRVIMLFGDDISDFIQCTRSSPVAPCTEPATRASRHAALEGTDHYWGHGWYILPNPMHGSWTQAK